MLKFADVNIGILKIQTLLCPRGFKTLLLNGHLLLERWKVSVDGYAAEVVNEREMF